jgi:hypothetical protein
MSRSRTCAVLAAVVVSIGAAVVVGTWPAASADTATAVVITPTTAHGTGFQVHNGLDFNFCVDVAPGSTEGRPVTLQFCSAVATQRWGFTWNADETNNIIDSIGMCLDGARPQSGVASTVTLCKFSGPWHFTYSSTGLIQNVKTGLCLDVARAGSNAPVFFNPCDDTKLSQQWRLGI